MSRKHKKVCITINYIEHFLFLASAINGCSVLTYLIGILIEVTSSAIRSKICAIAAGIKKYKLIINKKKKTLDWIVLLKKYLNSIEVLISKALIDWNTNHD